LTGPGGGGGGNQQKINKKAMNELDAEQCGDMAAVIVIDDENEEIGVRMGDQGARGGESRGCGQPEATSVEVGREVRILGVEPFPSSLWLSWSLFQVKALSVCRRTRVCGCGGADGLEQGRECAF
jgi:hypothetical protein